MGYRREWGGIEWQQFALQLVQRRHGADNVQVVPDTVMGDAGLEFFTTNGCAYQCYAPKEAHNTKKAASGMKNKAARDLSKLIKNRERLAKILHGVSVRRWILLCPFLDDKDVVADVRKRGVAVKEAGLIFISEEFEALCHSQEDFAAEIDQLQAMSLGPPLSLKTPTDPEIAAAGATSIGQKIDAKLSRALGLSADDPHVAQRRNAYVKAHLYRENALDQLRQNHSVLWERAYQSLEAEEVRLVAIGAASTLPVEQLNESTARIEDSLTKALPSLSTGIVTQIAVGTVSDWLIRCPLDFPEPC